MAQISNISLTPYGALKNEQEVRDARRAELYSFAANYLAHFIENLSKEKQFVYLNLTNKTFCTVNRKVLWPIGNIGSISKNDAFVSRLSDFQSRMMAGRKDNDVLGEVEHYAVTMLAQYLYNRTELIKG